MINLGQRIRKERQAKGWSLKKLSSLIGVSIMTLQRIETGKVSPSVDLLVEISYQLGMPVTEFVSDKERTLTHLTAAELPKSEDDNQKMSCIFPEGLVAEGFSVWAATITPGGVIEDETGKRFEGSFIVDGQTEIEFDDRKVRLQKGETIFYDARFRQKVKSNTGAEAIMVYKD